MKIKPYKIQKRDYGYKPYVLVFQSLPKPKVPFRLFTKVHKPNFYQIPQIIVEVVVPVEAVEAVPVVEPAEQRLV